MPINHKVCLPYKDLWVAPGSDMFKALEEKDYAKAEQMYRDGERVNRELEARGQRRES